MTEQPQLLRQRDGERRLNQAFARRRGGHYAQQEALPRMMHVTESMFAQVTPGMEVKTFDGQRLGVVQAVGASGFLTRRKYREGFWLPEGLVRDVDEERVLLHIDSRVLPRYSQRVNGTRPSFVSTLTRSRALLALGIVLAGALTLMGAV